MNKFGSWSLPIYPSPRATCRIYSSGSGIRIPKLDQSSPRSCRGRDLKLEDMTISNIYKLLYDGYGSKEVSVKK